MVGTYRILSKFVHLVHQLHTTVVSRQVAGVDKLRVSYSPPRAALLIGGCPPAGGVVAGEQRQRQLSPCLLAVLLRPSCGGQEKKGRGEN